MNRHNWTEKAARVPKRINDARRTGYTQADMLLIAEAIQRTRVSYLTKEQRDRLSLLVTRITGYRIEGGL